MYSRRSIVKYAILFAGLVSYTLSGLNWNIGIAAWVAPILLLYYTKKTKWPGFLLFYLCMVVSAGLSKTAENLSGLFVIYFTTGLSHGLVNSLPYVIEKLLVKREDKFYCTLVFPSAVVLVEYLLSLVLGIWGNSSIAQYHHLDLIQMTSLFGIFGISFLVTWLASIVNWFIINGVEQKYIRKGLGIYAIGLSVALLYGGIRINIFPPRSGTVNVASVISDTDIHQVFHQWEKEISVISENVEVEIPDDVYSSTSAVESQLRKTQEALKSGAKIVVWNEISLILKQPQKDSLLLQIRRLCIENKGYVLTAFLEEEKDKLSKPFNNTSSLITPDGEIAWTYVKSYLNPLEKLIINQGEAKVPFIDTEYGRIGNAICSDIDLTRYMTQIGNNRIDILLVPAFDWEEITPYHSHMAAFTAIQFGASIVRSNGNGIVASFDYQGNVLARTNTFTSDTKINYAEIPVQSTSTLYSEIGDTFAYIVILFLLFILGLRLMHKRSHKHN